jgi:Sulfotransferase domain
LVAGEISSSAQVMTQVPDIHKGINGQHLFGNHTTVVKTHWKYWTGIPLREDMIGVVYVIRNPVDVLESNQNYAFQRSGSLREEASPEEISRFAERWVEDYLAHGGYSRFQQSGFGSWEENVRSWTWSGLSVPCLLVRYEELLPDPVSGLARIARFLGMSKSDDDVRRAVERSSRERMRAIEEREIAERTEGLFYQARNSPGLAAGHHFVGRSVGGEPLFRLTDAQKAAARRRFAPIMQEFGYQ